MIRDIHTALQWVHRRLSHIHSHKCHKYLLFVFFGSIQRLKSCIHTSSTPLELEFYCSVSDSCSESDVNFWLRITKGPHPCKCVYHHFMNPNIWRFFFQVIYQCRNTANKSRVTFFWFLLWLFF